MSEAAGTVTLQDRLVMYDRAHVDPRVSRDGFVRILSDERKMENTPTADDIQALVQHLSKLASEQSTPVRVATVQFLPDEP